MNNYQDFAAVLTWLAAGGAATFVVNWLVANFLEKAGWWNSLDKSLKTILPLILAILIGIGAGELSKQVEVINAIQPYWTTIVLVVTSYFGSQTGHVSTKTAIAKKL